jgi:hypothetical protein
LSPRPRTIASPELVCHPTAEKGLRPCSTLRRKLAVQAAATLVPQSGLSEGLRRGVNRPKRARGPKLDHELIGPLVLGDLGMG